MMNPRDGVTAAYPSYRAAPPRLLGGALCLDFVNTVEWRGAPERAERLTGYGEVLAWAEAAGAIGRRARARLEAAAKARPEAAAALLASAVALREALAELFGSGSAQPALVERLNAWLARAPERTRLAASVEGYGWAAAGDRD